MFEAAGLAAQDAALVTDVLIHADLRGHASHGLTRIPVYVSRIRAGAINARPRLRFERPSPAFLYVDADNGPGPVVTMAAMRSAIETASDQGVCAAVVGHSNHNGSGSYYVEKAVAAGCIAIAMTNAPPSMAVYGGREAAIGTNPITFGVPVTGAAPVLADMATSVVARGKIVEAAKRGESIPEGWALDRDGHPTTDAAAAESGVVLAMAGAKGSALAIMVEALCGVLAGGRFAGSMGNLYTQLDLTQDVAHFFLVIDIKRTHQASSYGDRIRMMVDELKSGAPADGFDRIRMPGEVEAERVLDRMRVGIELPENVIDDLNTAALSSGLRGLNLRK